MSSPPARFLSRSGLLSFLRRLGGSRDRSRHELSTAIAREVGRATKPLRRELRDVIKAQRQLQQEAHEDQRVLRQGIHDAHREVRLLRAIMAANSAGHFARHVGAMNLPEVTRHVASAIAAAPLEVTPMPHLLVTDFLPDATYQALLDATPPDQCFTERDPIKQNFRPAHSKLVPDFTAAMWAFVEEQVVASISVPALMARFRPYIDALYAERYGERGAAVSALRHEASAGRLMLRRPGYHLDPHIDPQRVVVTCLLYLANPGDSVEFGTQLFSLNAVPTVSGTKTYYPGEAGYVSSLEKTVPFTPNTAVAFLNAGAAAHGATIPDSAPKGTKRYAYQFYVSPDARDLAAIIGETADETPN